MSRLADNFKLLSVEARLRIVRLLQNGEPLCVKVLACRLGMTPSAVSQHLRILKSAGWVTSTKNGYWVHYSLRPRKLRQLRKQLDSFLAIGERRGVSAEAAVKKKRR